MSDPRSIGIFDSGVGGLTVVRAVLDLVPGEPVLYFGDTARAPYGPRAVYEIRAFAREVAAYLLGRDVKMLVVACNGVELRSAACPAFVPHVERGDTTSPELMSAARGYLAPMREAGVDTLILGCTHYPLLSGLLQRVMGPDVVLVSSAEETAKDVYAGLLDGGLLRDDSSPPEHEFLCSGDPGSFRALAARFLGPEAAGVRAQSVQPAPVSER